MSSPNLNPLNNGSYWGPVNEAPEEILLEKLFLASGWMTGLTCGMQFIIYILCVYVLFTPSPSFTRTQLQQPKAQQSPNTSNSRHYHRGFIHRLRRLSSFTLFLLTYSTILCIVNILYTGSSYVALQLTYISDRNFPGGPIGFLNAEAPLPSNVMSITMLVLSSVLSDALLLWRCRLIWRLFTDWKADLVMLFPFMMLLGSFASGMLWNITIASPSGLYGTATAHAGLAYFTLSLSTNIILTSLIVIRIYVYQLHLRKTMGYGYGYDGQYTGIAAMFVESSMMSCMGSLFLLVTTALNSSINQVGIGFAPAFQIISTYLIILRVGQGRAWSKTTVHQGQGITGATSTAANRGGLSTIIFTPQERSLRTDVTGTNTTRMDISQLEYGDMTGIQCGNGIDGEGAYALDGNGVKVIKEESKM